MSQTEAEYCLFKIIELIDEVIERESIPSNSESYEDLDYVKLYAKDLANQCKDHTNISGPNNKK